MVMLTKCFSYREVCEILHIPNFSVFSMGHESKLAESLRYSTAVELWSTFEEKAPHLRGEIEACPPLNWEQLPEVDKFSWLVSRYCDLVQSSSNSPPESRSGQVQDSETVIESAEAIECSPRSDTQVLFDWGDLGELDWAVDFMRSYDSF